MSCFNPMLARNGTSRYVSGKPILVFRRKDSPLSPDLFPIQIPCSQCIGCRIEYGRQMAMRCMKERECHDASSFVTLTYSGDRDMTSLEPRDYVLFMKKVRNVFGSGIKMVVAGEYTKAFRPHFHLLLFGVGFRDKVPYKVSPSGEMLYRSPLLEGMWTKGFSSIGDVTFESAAYVCKYSLKKVTGVRENDEFNRVIEENGLLPEFVQFSRRGGIGRAWFEKYADEVFPMDRVWMRDKWMKPPRFFTQVYAKDHPLEVELIKLDRKNNVDKDDNTDLRLFTKERSAVLNLLRRKKSLEVVK